MWHKEFFMKFSERILSMPASPIRRLMPYADSAKERGIEVYHANIGQPDIKAPDCLATAMQQCATDYVPYGPSAGLMSYRKALVKYYQSATGAELKPENILVTTAGSEALLFSFMALCNPGDEIIVPEPFYANVAGFACETGVKLVALPTKFEEGFALPDPSVFASVISDRTRAVYICNPGNPTGIVYTRESLLALAELAKQHDFFLIGDEVYREFVYPGTTWCSLLSLPGVEDRVIVVDSVSKRYSLCGARIGCLVSRNTELLALILKLGQARLCPPTNEQHMLTY
ncbi:aspartate aminotransferase, partial [candidate division KSB3 bacterium]